ncbi:MAG: tetratricopeptide repeat protein [Myxococcota bacterium]
MKRRTEQISEWARQMGVPEDALRRFLSEFPSSLEEVAADAHGVRSANVQTKKVAAELHDTANSAVGQAGTGLVTLLEVDSTEDAAAGLLSDEERELLLLKAEQLLELGQIEFGQSRYEEARSCFVSALKVFQEHSNQEGEGRSLGYLGSVSRIQGDFDQAIAHYKQSISLLRSVGDKRSEGVQLGLLAVVYMAQAHHEQAIEHYGQALTICRETGDKLHEGHHLGNLGLVHLALGQLDQAIEYHSQALEIARDIGDTHGEAKQAGDLASAYQDRGQFDQAIAHFRQSIRLCRVTGDKRRESLQLGNLGIIYTRLGQLERSVESHAEAIAISRKIDDKLSLGIHLGNLGDSLVKLERFHDSEVAFRQAIELCEESIPAAAGAYRGSLALLCATQGNMDEANTLLEIGERQVKVYPDEYIKFLCKKGLVWHIAGRSVDAQHALAHAHTIAADIESANNTEVTQALADLTALLDTVPG